MGVSASPGRYGTLLLTIRGGTKRRNLVAQIEFDSHRRCLDTILGSCEAARGYSLSDTRLMKSQGRASPRRPVG